MSFYVTITKIKKEKEIFPPKYINITIIYKFEITYIEREKKKIKQCCHLLFEKNILKIIMLNFKFYLLCRRLNDLNDESEYICI
jgi:hypothetical protein